MSEGPTVAGSIVGKLKMDRDQWNAMKRATMADIAALESMDPKILVRMNARDALLEADRVAEATDRITTKTKTLGDAQDSTATKTIKANEANRTAATRMGMITTAVALLLPLMAPVAAAAVGIGGAFLGMGAAGVFALVGINREMDRGTALGAEYAAGVGQMRAAFGTLSATAALNMLSSFRRVVAETTDAMPFLNGQIGALSTILGRSGANVFEGALNSLRVMNPLLMTAAVWVEQLSQGFLRWTQNGGLEQFASYALTSLPQVVDVLGALATMVLHILTALAPLGTIGMAVLTGIADTINAIPVEVLGTLIGMVTWGAIAFKAWGFIAPMLSGVATAMGAVGAATTIATGPIGWAVAGIAALASIIAIAATNTRGAAAATGTYTTAVQADSGAIEENVRLKAAQALMDAGAIDDAKALGIATNDVVEATLGNVDAQKRVAEAMDVGAYGSEQYRRAMEASGLGLVDFGLAHSNLKRVMDEQSGGIRGAIDDYNTLQAALGATTTASALQRSELELAAATAGVSVAAYEAVDASQGDLAFQTEKATAQMYLQNDAAGLLQQALDLLNGKALDSAEAQNQFESQLVNMPQFADAASASIDGMSAAAVGNRGSLLGQIEAAQQAAQAFRDEGGSVDETKAKLDASKQSIIDNAVAHGMNRAEVQSYIDKLFQIPASIPPTKVEADTERARAQVEAFIANVNSRVASIQVRATMPDLNGAVSGSGRPGVAMGGTIRGLAGGGSGGTVFGPGTAGSDSAGMFRLARGEEVISNVHGQADRSRALLKQINAGFVPSQQAAGVAAEPAKREPQKTITHVHHWHVTSNDGLQLAQQFANRQNQLAAGS